MADADLIQGSRDIPRSADIIIDRNMRFLYLEILFASILAAVVTFNSAFAIRLGADDTLVAWLTSAPALISAIASIPAARYLNSRKRRKLWLFGSLFLTRVGYVLVALMPILIPVNTAFWLVVWVIALNLPGIFFTNGFQVLLAELIPEQRRARVISRRQIFWSIGIVISTAVAGFWLDHVKFPLNYELMYLFGFVTVLGSHFYLHRLDFPERNPESIPSGVPVNPAERIAIRQPIARMLFNITVYQIGLSMPSALFNIYYINFLHASDGWIGLNGAAGSAGVIIGYLIWERLIRRRTYSWAQRRASVLTWIFPVSVGLFPSLPIIALANFLVNVMHSGVDLSNFNILLRIARPHERMAYVSWINASINVSAFIAPLAGTWLALLLGPRYGIQIVMLLSGSFRLLGGVLFNVKPVEDPAQAEMIDHPR